MAAVNNKKFDSLTQALDSRFEKKFYHLPRGLKYRIEIDFCGMLDPAGGIDKTDPAYRRAEARKTWDGLSPDQRRRRALEWDIQNDPELREDCEFWFSFFGRVRSIEQQLDKSRHQSNPSTDNRVLVKILTEELARMELMWKHVEESETRPPELINLMNWLPGVSKNVRNAWMEGYDVTNLADSSTPIRHGDRTTKDSRLDESTDPLSVFQAMDSLKFNEIKIQIDPERLSLRISARKSKSMTSFNDLELAKRNGITLNAQGRLFMAMANGTHQTESPGTSNAIGRLSATLRRVFGSRDTPFIRGRPQFKVSIPKDAEAKRRATSKTGSYDDTRLTITSDTDTDSYLRDNDPNYDPGDDLYSNDPDLSAGD